jgi:hypothetical protein
MGGILHSAATSAVWLRPPRADERSLADAGFSEDQECLGLTIGRPVQDLSDYS